jgi:hypothetical protein
VTRHPTAEWLAQQIVEAFPWGTTPTYLVRDNDRELMGGYSGIECERWGFGTARYHRGRPGRIHMLNARSGRSGGTLFTFSLSVR